MNNFCLVLGGCCVFYLDFDYSCVFAKVTVTVTVRLQNFSPFTIIQTVRSHYSTLVQARRLMLSMCVHLTLIYKINEHCHAWMFLLIS